MPNLTLLDYFAFSEEPDIVKKLFGVEFVSRYLFLLKQAVIVTVNQQLLSYFEFEVTV